MQENDQTEIRMIELMQDVEQVRLQYAIQYRNKTTHGLWTTLPVVRTSNKETYQRMKDGADG
jgi:hypothetical protein